MTGLSPEEQHRKWQSEQRKTRSDQRRLAYQTVMAQDGTKITTPHMFNHPIDAAEAVRNHPLEWSFKAPEKARPTR